MVIKQTKLARKTVVEFAAITTTYDLGDVKVEVLKGIDLSFYQGEYSAIMGASGSGKSSGNDIIDMLDNLHKAGKAVIAVTHGADVAKRVERIVRISDGMIKNEER